MTIATPSTAAEAEKIPAFSAYHTVSVEQQSDSVVDSTW